MGSVSYGKLEVTDNQQGLLLGDLPAAMLRDCYFDEKDVASLLSRSGASRVCPHCGQRSVSPCSPRQAKVLAQRLLDHWRQCHLVTYSAVLDKYRRLP